MRGGEVDDPPPMLREESRGREECGADPLLAARGKRCGKVVGCADLVEHQSDAESASAGL